MKSKFLVQKSVLDSDDINSDVFAKLVQDRIIFLHEEIDSKVSSFLVATLLHLNAEDPTKEITVFINSNGGELFNFFAIYDAFQLITAPIRTICIGAASSAAAILLAAGTPGLRYATQNSQIMIHNIQVSDLEGSKNEIQKEFKRLEEESRCLIEILARHTGQPFKVVEEDCQYDKYISPKEAIKYGIIDNILKPRKKPLPLRKYRKKK